MFSIHNPDSIRMNCEISEELAALLHISRSNNTTTRLQIINLINKHIIHENGLRYLRCGDRGDDNIKMLLNYHGVIEFNLRPFYENPGKFHRVNLRPSAPGFLYGYNGSRAVVFTDTVEYDHILPLLEKDLENARCKRFGRPHSSVLTALNNLAVLLDVSGEFYRALSLYNECLEMSTTYFCKYHCEALLTMSNLAALFANNGQYNLALSLYEEILAETKCDYSKIKIPLNQVIPSPLNLITRHNIANLFKNNCEYDRALPLYEECLAINSIIFKLSRMTYLCNLVKPSPYAFGIAGGVMNNLQYNNKLEF